jgi:hypothetical protein
MPLMTGNRDDVVRTKAGHSVAFKAGQDTFVPDMNDVVKECTARGHTLKKGEKEVVSTPATTEPVVEKKVATK